MTALVIAIVAAVAAFMSTVFTGMSVRFLAKQTQALADQNRLMYAASELTFNLDVMVRLQEVLLHVADDESTYQEVWGSSEENRRPQVAGEAVLDVLSMALKACNRLPGFASNESDWSSYAEYVMATSPALRKRAMDHPDWWPEVTPFADKAMNATTYADNSSSSSPGTAPPPGSSTGPAVARTA
ncbi:hypothetical protein AB0I34_39410 [Kribbella sp. NPDC050281]|uniref:hypothetical protein n=1 Tax=Kribbella sp. NPDC050281 TaxID=3155515 RepID=UPI0033C13A89